MRTDVALLGLLEDQVRRPPTPSAPVSSLALTALAGIAGGLIGAVAAPPAAAPPAAAEPAAAEPPAATEATTAAADASVEGTAAADPAAEQVEDPAPPAPSKPAPTKVAYHPNVRCLRGGGGVGQKYDSQWRHPVIVGPMYRVGEGCVSEEKATEEEKAKGPVEPAELYSRRPVEGFDLRGWKKTDIQGLRGADGKLDLVGAILCGVNLREAKLQGANLAWAQLQGADLSFAQLQGADLSRAQLQGADLYEAQLQGADLHGAQLQGADLRKAQLQGASLDTAELQGAGLFGAQLQGARLRRARLQGADLSGADLSVLPKDSILPKDEGVAGETEATKKDRPTILERANLSVLPKGSEYRDGSKVKVSDAVRPTNLTDAKASGADFSEADLRGATFTAATIKGATLKDAQFMPFRPPERPASGALSGAWRIKSLLGSVGRAVVAAAADDDNNDDDDSDGESEEEEEAPDGVGATMEKAVEGCMDRLAIGAQVFMCAVDKLLSKVEDHKDSLLTDGALKDRLCKTLTEEGVKQAAVNDILSTVVISPLLEFIRDTLQEVLQEALLEPLLQEALSELSQPSKEAAGTTGRQLLDALKDELLKAGEAALLKRLSPIVSKWLRASRARVVPGPAVDEEQARLLQEPENSAKSLVQELWPALLASLKAQVSDVILSSALPPIEKASKSVRQIAGRLDELENALSTKADAESQRLAKRFGLVGGDKGSLRSRLLQATLTAATQYEVRVGGFNGSLDMVRLAWSCSRARLTKHENELQYLKEELKKLKDLTTTDQTWRDVTETWQATLALLKSIEVERGRAVLQCIASDEKLLKAVGMAETLYKAAGDVPTEVVVRLNDGAGAHIRAHAYKYDKLISQELVRIQQVKDIQWRALTLAGSALIAAMIGTANLFSRLYFRVLESDKVMESERWLLALLFPLGAVVGLLLLLMCCACCYYRRSLAQGAGRLQGRLRALWPCGMRSTRKTAPASQRVQVKKEAKA